MFRLLLAPGGDGGGKPGPTERPPRIDEETEEIPRDDEVVGTDADAEAEAESEEAPEKPEPKAKAKERPKGPKLVTVTAQELKALREKAQAAEQAEKKQAKSAERLAAEREERVAKEDAAKGLDLARKRLQREIDRRDDELGQLREQVQAYEARLKGLALSQGVAAALESVLAEKQARLKKGALKHINNDLRGQVELEDDDAVEGGFRLVHRDSGQPLGDYLATRFEDDDYALFLDGGQPTKPPTPAVPRGTNRPTPAPAQAPAQQPTYAEIYKRALNERATAPGVRPPRGVARTQNGNQ